MSFFDVVHQTYEYGTRDFGPASRAHSEVSTIGDRNGLEAHSGQLFFVVDSPLSLGAHIFIKIRIGSILMVIDNGLYQCVLILMLSEKMLLYGLRYF